VLPFTPAMDAVVTIEPPSPAAIRRLATHCDAKNGTRTFADIVSSY
jgi:hypothetical protein